LSKFGGSEWNETVTWNGTMSQMPILVHTWSGANFGKRISN